MDEDDPRTSVRSIWISDTHLGFPGANACALLEFLQSVRCEQLYLVGDIIDFWALRRRRHWPQTCNNLIRTVLGMAKHGTRVVYLPGNHDDAIRQYDGLTLGKIAIHDRVVHETADGRRLLVMHGDQFDSVVISSRLVGLVGSRAYALLLNLNRLVNWCRLRMGKDHWSLAAAAKKKVKKAATYIANFEGAIARETHNQGVDGLVCGHIHRAELTWIDDVLYINCGDWVESATAFVEHHDGTLELWKLGESHQVLRRLAPDYGVSAA